MYCSLVLFLFTTGCTNEYAKDIKLKYNATSERILTLRQQLDNRKLSNANLIYSYAASLAAQKPELSKYISVLRQEAGSSGVLFKSLSKRLESVNINVENRRQYEPVFKELESIWAGSDPVIYNDSLMDVVNTLADLSDGKLARINIPKKTQTESMPGSYLVGNPNYGQWQHQSNGTSFWQWYGQYRFFSDLMGGNRIYDNQWYGHQRNSYYNDWGRSTYGGYSENQRWKDRKDKLSSKGVVTTKPKHYGNKASQKRISTYASMRKNNANSLKNHSGTVSNKRTSSFLNTGQATRSSSTPSSKATETRRSSSFFGSSRSSSSQSSRSRFGGGK